MTSAVYTSSDPLTNVYTYSVEFTNYISTPDDAMMRMYSVWARILLITTLLNYIKHYTQ